MLVLWAARRLLASTVSAGSVPAAGAVLLFCLAAAAGLYAFFITALLVMGLLMRLLSIGVKPGRYSLFSVTTVLWIAMNSIQTLALRFILPVVAVSYLPLLYYRLAGSRIGRDVWLTAVTILDPSLVSIGDGTVLGGDVTIAAHIVSSGHLYLGPVSIGRDCRIGAHALICAGVTVGDGANVGVRTYLRKGRVVPPGGNLLDAGGIPPMTVVALQGEARTAHRRTVSRNAARPGPVRRGA
jgi:acetyltransferase-like isoleucine patch superfamily enzyme